MIKKLYLTVIICCLFGLSIQAQYAYFGSRGTISFDKVTYTKARLRQMSNDINSKGMDRGAGIMEYLDKVPDSHTEKLKFYFDENSTVLMPEESAESDKKNAEVKMTAPKTISANGRGGRFQGAARSGASPRGQFRGGAKNGKVLYQDLKAGTADIQLDIDEKYILSETLDSITWRFTEEYRNIAGVNCRRVNGATKDSLYLIAYYSEEIPVSAGPALSHGLPGMIIGLVIPEMHIQYWATTIEYTNKLVPADWRDKKSKKMELNEFSEIFGRYMPLNRQNESAKKRILEQLVY
ncbi:MULTISPECIES: GLPGLI family protein [unclassified Sphingobacterium]|uniref:GLPGLI family protein n=1 Tax=unclassified Sphingobacterium TaxID=2609468 RepID=UPI001AEB1145|nr:MULTISPECIES: GLPGLI family protein [unclassified Sphingobacterium]MDR6736301.1 GLPGLI family protein [Sphingobacterium sp. 2149]